MEILYLFTYHLLNDKLNKISLELLKYLLRCLETLVWLATEDGTEDEAQENQSLYTPTVTNILEEWYISDIKDKLIQAEVPPV